MPAESKPVAVPSEDAAKKKIEADRLAKNDPDEDLTEEEKQLKEDLELLVERVCEPAKNKEAVGVQAAALESIRTHIRTSTSSMTSVPLPLKFLAPHYDKIKDAWDDMPTSDNKKALADIISVCAMTLAEEGSGESLTFKLKGTTDCGFWGHEYVRSLAGQIGTEHKRRLDEGLGIEDLNPLIDDILPFNVEHGAEYEAIDLLLEVEQLSKLEELVTKDNHTRICKYLLACTDYIADHEDREKMLTIAYVCSLKFEAFADALRYAIKLGSDAHNKDRILEIFEAAEDENVKRQLAYMLSTQRIVISDFEDDDELMEIIGNVRLNGHFLRLAQELDVLEPKSPEDIYKSHLAEGGFMNRRPGATNVDSARQNLASTFVNAFVNCGFGTDTLITPEGSDWLYKNKTHGMLSAAASLGMLVLWNVETGFSDVDKYSFSTQNFIKSGVLLATGLLTSGVSSELDAAYALLSEHVETEGGDNTMKASAIIGLGLAYAGSAREDVLDILTPLIVDETQNMEIVSLTCLALGLIFVGTANEDVSGSIIEGFLDRSDTDLRDSVARMMCLGIGLLFLGKGDACEGILAAISAIEHPIKKYLEVTVQTCAYVGTSNILEIQKLQSLCSEHFKETEEDQEEEKKEGEQKSEDSDKKKPDPFESMHQEVAVLGIAMISMGESISSQMALRILDHFLQYGEVNIRRAVPLALGMLSISNPQLPVIDTLSKLSHDQDERISQNAILGMGFLGAGTNNSRIANLLRQLAVYYGKEPNHLFLVRISQGLLHMGKGLMTLSPFHSDGLLLSKVALAGILTVLHTSFDLKNSILSNRHYLLFALTTAIRPRCLVTLDEDGEFLPLKVRVGQAVDIVGQAGQPRTITGFQTHTTPVLLSAGERAELNDDEYLPLTPVLEGFVIVRKNPDSQDVKRKPDEQKE